MTNKVSFDIVNFTGCLFVFQSSFNWFEKNKVSLYFRRTNQIQKTTIRDKYLLYEQGTIQTTLEYLQEEIPKKKLS